MLRLLAERRRRPRHQTHLLGRLHVPECEARTAADLECDPRRDAQGPRRAWVVMATTTMRLGVSSHIWTMSTKFLFLAIASSLVPGIHSLADDAADRTASLKQLRKLGEMTG